MSEKPDKNKYTDVSGGSNINSDTFSEKTTQ
ncbi:MAG: hypothetical protein BMS9Abin31_0724 [Gammaproteobacteria bacterium]|nr:MAG: hypothetical protein BMS9Abin31_0724 [Gammaproteobacteria bacterium]